MKYYTYSQEPRYESWLFKDILDKEGRKALKELKKFVEKELKNKKCKR